jgi:hypothetical protein
MPGWQSGYAAACKAVDAGSIPTPGYYPRPGGEIGRRKGLKIPRELNPVPVRLRPRAPCFALLACARKATHGRPGYDTLNEAGLDYMGRIIIRPEKIWGR